MSLFRTLLLAAGTLAIFPALSNAKVTAERTERGVVIKIDGQLFTEYLTQAGKSPAMWPIIGPTGQPMTRSYPVGPAMDGETNDHPHHQSLWLTHDKVNGADFWAANTNDDAQPGNGPSIEHRGFKLVQCRGTTARIVSRNVWMNRDEPICDDERSIVFGTRNNGDRWIDVTVTICASYGDVTFGDTKEGTFAIRVADSMRVEAKLGGKIVNSEGQTDDAAWGMPARWVDYTGPLAGETVGITIFSHPSSFQPTPRWHVRAYGLFAANPFGERDFPASSTAKQGPFTLKKYHRLKLRYRVLLHRGGTDSAELERAYHEFAGPVRLAAGPCRPKHRLRWFCRRR